MISFRISLSVFLLSCVAADTSKNSAFIPARIHYDDLVNERISLLDALEDSSGIISMTNLPENFASVKKDVMSNLHSCILNQQQDRGEYDVAEESFPDGTVRRTLATATTALEGPLDLKLRKTTSSSTSCQFFEKNLELFRSIANMATRSFAKVLSKEMEPHFSKPLLIKRGNSEDSYDTIEDLVMNGDQLEHFHSYQKTERIGEEYDDDEMMRTIDVHADQGFFIAFTPGMMMSSNNKDNNTVASEGFYIVEEDSNKIPIQVDFNIDTDDLVFMLGDGVNQYINNRLTDKENSDRRHLRATPHAVSLKAHDDSQARVWYGRMVLPPKDALVAAESTQTTLTYGDIRRRLVETPDAYIPAGMGCSSPSMRALQHSLHDEPVACEKGTLFCWARCMELADYNITEEMCEEQNLGLKCINPRGQFSTGDKHGDFWAACTNTTLEVSDYPEIPQTPEGFDTSAAWKAFVDDGVYDHSFNLTTEANNGVILQWSVVDQEQGILKGRLAFNDVFGWLSIGFSHPEGRHNGMNGADILLALPGGNYTPRFGLQVPGKTLPGTDEISVEISKKKSAAIATETNPEGSTVYEYVINPEGSSFRHWYEPTGNTTSASESINVVVTEYATAMTWETNNINGKKFNMTGFDDLIWAGNSKDYHVGYHGRGNRARFYINWVTGEGNFWTKEEELTEEDSHDDHDHDDHDHDIKDDSAADHLSVYAAIFASALSTLLWIL
jgi:hypothetical protein